MPTLGDFRRVHPTYAARKDEWCKARMMYGSPLAGENKDDLESVFPRHYREPDDLYNERRSRAHYIGYAGSIIDKILADVFEQSVSVVPCKEDDVEDRPQTPDPTFYAEFEEDASRQSLVAGEERRSIQEYAKDWLREAQLTGHAWMQVCLPEPAEYAAPAEYATLAQEDESGARRAYLMLKQAECVLNWRLEDDGMLRWLVECREEDTRDAFDSSPSLRRVVYTVWTPQDWTEYAFEWDESKKSFSQLPDETQPSAPPRSGAHTFGAVPWVRLDLPDGLWTMRKLLSAAIEHFNKACALSWAEYNNLFPVLAAFLAGEDFINPATANPNRARTQRKSPGHTMEFGEKDRLEYVTPDSAPYTFTLQHLQHLRDEMHRVTYQMAQSVDNSGAALKRSGQSKAQDRMVEAVLSNAFGQILRQGLTRVYALVAAGRGEEVEWEAIGLQGYDADDTNTMVEEAAAIEAVGIPSATFNRKYKLRLALRLLGDDCTPDEAKDIEQELGDVVTPEQYQQPTPMEKLDAAQAKAEALGGAQKAEKPGEKPSEKPAEGE